METPLSEQALNKMKDVESQPTLTSSSGVGLSEQKCDKENFKVFEIVHGSFNNFMAHKILATGAIYKNKDASGERKKNSYNIAVKYQDAQQLYNALESILKELKELLPSCCIIKSPLRDNGKQFYLKFSSSGDMPDGATISLIATSVYIYKIDGQTTASIKLQYFP